MWVSVIVSEDMLPTKLLPITIYMSYFLFPRSYRKIVL